MNHVTKQLAIKLKQAGFDRVINTYYLKIDEVENKLRVAFSNLDWNNYSTDSYSAPDLHTVTDWLRECHGLHVFADPFKQKWSWNIAEISNDEFTCHALYSYPTHNEALAIGIDKAVDQVLLNTNQQ